MQKLHKRLILNMLKLWCILSLCGICSCDRSHKFTGNQYRIIDVDKAHKITDYSKNANINVFDTVIFGKWEQDADFTNGTEDIEWLVLDKDENQIRLISKYVLDYGNETKFYKYALNDYEKSFIEFSSIQNSDEIFATRKLKTTYTNYAKYKKNFYDDEYAYDGYWISGYINDGIWHREKASEQGLIFRSYRVNDDGEVVKEASVLEEISLCGNGLFSEEKMIIGKSGIRPVFSVSLSDIPSFNINNDGQYEYYDFEYSKVYDYNDIKKVRQMISIEPYLTDNFLLNLSVMLRSDNSKKYIDKNYYDKGTNYKMFDSVRFGKYEQDGNINNGMEDIEWIVVEFNKKEKTALLLSKYILEYMQYADERMDYSDIDFNTSNVKRFLNEEFYNIGFTDEQKALIEKSEVTYERQSGGESILYLKVFIPGDLYGYPNNDATDYTKYAMSKKNSDPDKEKQYSRKLSSYFLINPNEYVADNMKFYNISKEFNSNGLRPMIRVKYQ